MRLSYLLAGALVLGACGEPDIGRVDSGFGCEFNPNTGGVEVCNGEDDDCDGAIDEGPGGSSLRRACSSECGGGTEQCVGGAFVGCTAKIPATEICNGEDDDCDMAVDEDCDCIHGDTRPCGQDEGACRTGIQQCVDGSWLLECFGAVEPQTEVCGNGIDDDCNTQVDEGCQCNPGQTQSCGTDEGACTAGTLSCDANGIWGDCMGAVGPLAESCNGVDDNCDGSVDRTVGTGAGWGLDPFEPSTGCIDAFVMPDAPQSLATAPNWVSVPVSDPLDRGTFPTLYPLGVDEDWYRIRAVEGSESCTSGQPQCAFVFSVQLELPASDIKDDYEVCFSTAACGQVSNDNLICSSAANWNEGATSYLVAAKWGGSCGRDDSRDLLAVVRSKQGRAACGYYQLHATLVFDPNQACP